MKKYVILLLVSLVRLSAIAVPACPDSLCIVQPNGDTLWTYLHGDEFYHWRTTIDGYVIISDVNNYLRYAIVEGDSLRPSEMIAHNVENRSISEQAYIDSFSPITKQFIQAEIQGAYTVALNDTLLFPPAQHAASNYAASQPVVGTRKVLTILMEFEDRKFTNTRVVLDSLMNQRNGNIGPNQGSVRKYYLENSYGQMTIETTVVGPFEAEKSHTAYQRKQGGSSYRSKKLVQEAIQKAKSVVNFSTLDGDNDGYVDCVHIIYAGTKYVNNSSSEVFIWPYKYSISTTSINGKKVKDYIMTPELADDKRLAPIGTICHELGHILGAPDYYDASNYFYAMGNYDVMERGCWAKSGYSPSHHNPYTKCYIFGWDTPSLINTETNNYTLSSSTTTKGHFYRINTSTDGEYFLLENRTKEQFDAEIPNGGLLFYHIHKNLEACVSSWDSINNAHPLKLYLVNASAITEPNDSSSSYGGAYTQRAYPYNGKMFFTSNSMPSAISWSGVATGVNVCFIQIDNKNIKFVVNPKINGPEILSTQSTYSVTNVPAGASITWTYTFTPSNSLSQEHKVWDPIVFVNGNSTSSVLLKRGKYPVPRDTITPTPLPPGINSINSSLTTFVYFSGTAVLKATITSGGYSYSITKTITLSSSSNTALALEIEEETDNIIEDSTNLLNSAPLPLYNLRHVNPISSNNAIIHVEKLLGPSNVYVPNDENYTIEIWHHQLGLIKRVCDNTSILNLDCGDLPTGVYQMILIINGEPVAQSKLIKL